MIQAGQGLRYASAHRTARGYGGLPTHMIEQFHEISREACHGESLRALAGASMPTAIIGKDIGVNCEPGHNSIPDARVQRQRMDQDHTGQAWVACGAQGIGDGAVVRSLENALMHSAPR
jgi:hypothetical protein